MADIAFICVREDVAEAEALADILDAAGYAVTAENNDAALLASTVQLVIWSRAALRSRAFVAAAERAINADAAVVVCLDDPVATDLEGTPCFDLRAWDGAPEAAVLDPLLATLDQRTMDARAAGRNAGVLHLSLRPPGAEGVLARGGGDVGLRVSAGRNARARFALGGGRSRSAVLRSAGAGAGAGVRSRAAPAPWPPDRCVRRCIRGGGSVHWIQFRPAPRCAGHYSRGAGHGVREFRASCHAIRGAGHRYARHARCGAACAMGPRRARTCLSASHPRVHTSALAFLGCGRVADARSRP